MKQFINEPIGGRVANFVEGLTQLYRGNLSRYEGGRQYRAIRRDMNPESRPDLQEAGVQKVPDMYILKIDIARARFLSFPEGILNQVYPSSPRARKQRVHQRRSPLLYNN